MIPRSIWLKYVISVYLTVITCVRNSYVNLYVVLPIVTFIIICQDILRFFFAERRVAKIFRVTIERAKNNKRRKESARGKLCNPRSGRERFEK